MDALSGGCCNDAGCEENQQNKRRKSYDLRRFRRKQNTHWLAVSITDYALIPSSPHSLRLVQPSPHLLRPHLHTHFPHISAPHDFHLHTLSYLRGCQLFLQIFNSL